MEESVTRGAITICNRQDARALETTFLERLAESGEAAHRLIGERYLLRVTPPEEVSVSLIDDAEIGRIHGEFLDDPTPTDVITFPYGEHGEILISIETAERQASEFQGAFTREVALYLVHGLLHLHGYEDETESGRARMAELQEILVRETFGAQ